MSRLFVNSSDVQQIGLQSLLECTQRNLWSPGTVFLFADHGLGSGNYSHSREHSGTIQLPFNQSINQEIFNVAKIAISLY